jgi:SNF2 family DNA or RNA helicase
MDLFSACSDEGYTPGNIESASKTRVFFTILEQCVEIGDHLLVFSQSLSTLDLLEELLEKRKIPGISLE